MKIQDTNPMMSTREIKIINELIAKYKPRTVLEWGSGNSTLYFSEHPSVDSWLSIEHNGHYVSYLKEKTEPNTTVIWADKEWYIDSVKLNGRKYDMIIIDGIQREACLRVAHELVTDKGIILLHDSSREEYQSFINDYPHKVLTEGEIPVGRGFAHRGLTIFGGFDGSS